MPVKDPALTTIAGGEYLVVTLVYASLLYDLRRYRMLLWIVALDQALAAALPLIEILRGNVVATWKTLGPIPFDALLALVYALRAPRRIGRA